MLNDKFIRRVIVERIVDTRKYRYTTREKYTGTHHYIQIIRLPIKALGTTDAIDGWKVVAEVGK